MKIKEILKSTFITLFFAILFQKCEADDYSFESFADKASFEEYMKAFDGKQVKSKEDLRNIAGQMSYFASIDTANTSGKTPSWVQETDPKKNKFAKSVYEEAPKLFGRECAQNALRNDCIREFYGCVGPESWNEANFNAFLLWNTIAYMRSVGHNCLCKNGINIEQTVKKVADKIILCSSSGYLTKTTYKYHNEREKEMLYAAVSDVTKYIEALFPNELAQQTHEIEEDISPIPGCEVLDSTYNAIIKQNKCTLKSTGIWDTETRRHEFVMSTIRGNKQIYINLEKDLNHNIAPNVSGWYTGEYGTLRVQYEGKEYTAKINEGKIEKGDKHRNVHGIENIGNTCYLNASLQALHASSKFRQFLESISNSGEDSICGQLIKIFEDMDKGEINKTRMNEFVDQIKTYKASKDYKPPLNEMLTSKEQQDANEFINKLKALIESESEEKKKKKEYDEFLGGEITQTIKCSTCNNESKTTVPLTSELIVQDGQTLKGCLSAISTPENITEYNCEGCKQENINATKTAEITRMPEILIITLKRYKEDYTAHGITITKDKTAIKYTSEMVYNDKRYRLVAVIKQSGGMNITMNKTMNPETETETTSDYNGGHYTANVLGTDGNWYYTSDAYVKQQQTFVPDESNAYIFIYEKEDAPHKEEAQQRETAPKE